MNITTLGQCPSNQSAHHNNNSSHGYERSNSAPPRTFSLPVNWQWMVTCVIVIMFAPLIASLVLWPVRAIIALFWGCVMLTSDVGKCCLLAARAAGQLTWLAVCFTAHLAKDAAASFAQQCSPLVWPVLKCLLVALLLAATWYLVEGELFLEALIAFAVALALSLYSCRGVVVAFLGGSYPRSKCTILMMSVLALVWFQPPREALLIVVAVVVGYIVTELHAEGKLASVLVTVLKQAFLALIGLVVVVITIIFSKLPQLTAGQITKVALATQAPLVAEALAPSLDYTSLAVSAAQRLLGYAAVYAVGGTPALMSSAALGVANAYGPPPPMPPAAITEAGIV